MPTRHRSQTYIALWIVGLTLGWFEAAVVVYLRQIFYPAGFQFPLAIMPARLLGVEVTREACSLVLLGAIGWLAGRRLADRLGAFLLLFGIWDLMYYVVLKLVLGWPAGLDLRTWDILFLIPLPWTGPIWAPALVALAFVVIGSWLVWTGDRRRVYRAVDVAVLSLAAVVIVLSFLAEWRAVIDVRVPEHFPAILYAMGVAVGTAWFIAAERRSAHLAGR